MKKVTVSFHNFMKREAREEKETRVHLLEKNNFFFQIKIFEKNAISEKAVV